MDVHVCKSVYVYTRISLHMWIFMHVYAFIHVVFIWWQQQGQKGGVRGREREGNMQLSLGAEYGVELSASRV